MKASSLTTKLLSVLAVLMAVVMAFSGCNDNTTTADTSSTEDVAGDNDNDNVDADDTDDTDDTASEEEDNNKSSSTKSKTTKSSSTKSKTTKSSSTKSKTTKSKTTKSSTTTTGSTTFAKDPYSDIPDSVKNKEVHVLMWREYTKSEKKAVEDFQKKTGIKVRTTVTTESEYTTKLVSLIQKDAPDVVMMQSNIFPSIALQALQPLDNTKMKLSDSCWYKDYMNYYKINGNYYSVAMKGSWSVEDCNYVTYYNPTLLKECGVTDAEMPLALYKAGNWNWSTQQAIATKVKNAGTAKGYIGMSMQTTDMMMLSAGADFADYDYNKSQFTNKMSSPSSTLVEAWQQIATLNQQGLLASGWKINEIQQGKVGLFTAISYGLYNEGGWFDKVSGGYANLQAVPVAGKTQGSAYIPVRPKTWGVAKNADNMEGAAYFLRYYLDASNIDMDSTFYNDQFKWTWNEITKSGAKKRVMTGYGVCDYISSGTYTKILNELYTSNSGNVTTVLAKYQKNVNNAITKANSKLSKAK